MNGYQLMMKRKRRPARLPLIVDSTVFHSLVSDEANPHTEVLLHKIKERGTPPEVLLHGIKEGDTPPEVLLHVTTERNTTSKVLVLLLTAMEVPITTGEVPRLTIEEVKSVIS